MLWGILHGRANVWELLERTVQYSGKLNENDHLLEKNKVLQDRIVQHAMQYYGIEPGELDKHIAAATKEGRVPEKISVGQALKHLVRDWSAEGDVEHMDAFPCVLNTLLRFSDVERLESKKVLLPGSGLGRLGHDIHGLGGQWLDFGRYETN